MPAYFARIRLLRPANAALAALGALVGALLASQDPNAIPPAQAAPAFLLCLDWRAAAAAPAAAFLLAAFGNALNDRNDAELDRLAHPGRPIASGKVRRDEALAILAVLLVAGLGFAAFAGLGAWAIAAGNVVVLLLYERELKRRGLPGNAAVAYLVASTFLFGAAATGNPPAAWGFAWAVAGMAFASNLGRELLKDLEDVEADRPQRSTFPMRRGAALTRIAALGFVGAAILLSLWPILSPPPSWPKLAAATIAFADIVMLVACLLARANLPVAQRMLKLGMAVAAMAFFGAGATAAG